MLIWLYLWWRFSFHKRAFLPWKCAITVGDVITLPTECCALWSLNVVPASNLIIQMEYFSSLVHIIWFEKFILKIPRYSAEIEYRLTFINPTLAKNHNTVPFCSFYSLSFSAWTGHIWTLLRLNLMKFCKLRDGRPLRRTVTTWEHAFFVSLIVL